METREIKTWNICPTCLGIPSQAFLCVPHISWLYPELLFLFSVAPFAYVLLTFPSCPSFLVVPDRRSRLNAQNLFSGTLVCINWISEQNVESLSPRDCELGTKARSEPPTITRPTAPHCDGQCEKLTRRSSGPGGQLTAELCQHWGTFSRATLSDRVFVILPRPQSTTKPSRPSSGGRTHPASGSRVWMRL